MKVYFKIFVLAFVAFASMFTGAYVALDRYYAKDLVRISDLNEFNSGSDDTIENSAIEDDENLTELEKLAKTSNRINVIAFGLNDSLADTMMLLSFDPDTSELDVISVPRDTYYPIEGFNSPAQKKMNAIYGMKDIGGTTGMKKYLSEFFDVPIDYYVRIDFDAVSSIVDVLGGYDVNIPYAMDYDDDWDTPPLHIHFSQGTQHLDGDDTVRYLRWRKNNDGSHSEGDIQRVARQQDFVNAMLKKALSSKLPTVINTAMGYIKTDMTIENALSYAVLAAGMTSDDITFHTIEGTDKMMNGLSYWVHDPSELERLMLGLYSDDADVETDTAGADPSDSAQ